MPIEPEGSTVKLSQEDIQRFEAMEKRAVTLEEEIKALQPLKGVVNELKGKLDSSNSQVVKLQTDAKASQVEAFCLRLERDYGLTPAAIEAIRPIMNPDNGVVKMSEDAEPIPVEQAYTQSLEQIIKLAEEKDALFVPQKVDLPKGKQQEKKMSASEERNAQIAKLQADAKECGKELSDKDARMEIAGTSNSILDKIDQMTSDEEGN